MNEVNQSINPSTYPLSMKEWMNSIDQSINLTIRVWCMNSIKQSTKRSISVIWLCEIQLMALLLWNRCIRTVHPLCVCQALTWAINNSSWPSHTRSRLTSGQSIDLESEPHTHINYRENFHLIPWCIWSDYKIHHLKVSRAPIKHTRMTDYVNETPLNDHRLCLVHAQCARKTQNDQ